MNARFFIPLLLASAALAAEMRKEDVAEQRLSLAGQGRIEEYAFGRDGLVFAQFGSKDGPVTAPVLSWRIEDGNVVIANGDRIMERFQLIERSENRIKLRRRTGEAVEFQITPLARTQRP